MYGYQEHLEITPEQLLQKVTQEQIFEFVLKAPFSFELRYCSPLRKDTKPGCRFDTRPDGTIVFIDFGEKLLTGRTHRTCFAMVMEAFNVNLTSAIRIICDEFGLSTNANDYERVNIDRVYDRANTTSETDIQYEAKIPTKSDIWYWSQFFITMDDLKQDESYCVKKFSIRNHKGFRTINIYKFCYVFDFISKKKIYQPFSDKYKWITNCDENNIGNIDNLPPTGDELIIQKSYKDHRILRNMNLGLNVIWFQNEGCVPSIEILVNLVERFTLITIFYDNDEDGILAATKLADILNMIRSGCARVVYLPRRRKHKQLFGHYLKDPAEFGSKEGRQDLITVLKQIGINGKNT